MGESSPEALQDLAILDQNRNSKMLIALPDGEKIDLAKLTDLRLISRVVTDNIDQKI